jgi:hypothetical protein
MHNIDPLKTQLYPICNLLALLEAHHILHVSRIRVNRLVFITEIKSVYSAVRTIFWNIIPAELALYRQHLRAEWILTCELGAYLWRNTVIGHCWTQSKGNHEPRSRISLFFFPFSSFFPSPAVTKIRISIRTSACHSVYLVQLTRSHGLLLRQPQ